MAAAQRSASSGCSLVMFALLALVLGWLLVVRPLSDALDAAKRAPCRGGRRARRGAGARGAGAGGCARRRRRRCRSTACSAAPRPRPASPARGSPARARRAPASRSMPRGRRPCSPGSRRLEQSGLVVERLRARANSDRTLPPRPPSGRGRADAVSPAARAHRLLPRRLRCSRWSRCCRCALAIGWFGFGGRGLAAREASGSLWLGALRRRSSARCALGDVTRAAQRPAALPRPGAAVARRADADDGASRARSRVTRHSFGFDDVTGQLPHRRPVRAAADRRRSTSTMSAPASPAAAAPAPKGRVRAGVAGEIGGIAAAVRPRRRRALRRRRAAAAAGRPDRARSSSTSASTPTAATGSTSSSARPTRPSAPRLAAAGFRAPATAGSVRRSTAHF